MTFEEQKLLLRQYLWASIRGIVKMIHNEAYQLELAAEIDKRIEEGYKMYGSQMWGYTPKQLQQDTLEEVADAVIYNAVKMAIEAGRVRD